MTYKQALLKKNIEYLLIYPIVLIGKLAGFCFPIKGDSYIFLFFPNADIGGSIKVNAEITDLLKEIKPIIIFSKKPHNNEFIEQYKLDGVRIIYLHKYIDNKIFHFVNVFFRGVIASWVNKAKRPIIFGGECIFFYKMIPHVKSETKIVELCHVSRWINYTQAFIPEIDARIFSTQLIKREVEQQYIKNDIAKKYFDKLFFVDNKIKIPAFIETNNPALEVVFIGRNAPQKRVHLTVEIAKKLKQAKANIHFSFVGDLGEYAATDMKEYCTFHGLVKDKAIVNDIYNKSDVLILTSAFEGLPIVVMEMMARGKVVLSTAVSGIPDYITHLETGLLVFKKDETEIVKACINLLTMLEADRLLLKKLGLQSYNFAKNKFSAIQFDAFYKNIFLNNQ